MSQNDLKQKIVLEIDAFKPLLGGKEARIGAHPGPDDASNLWKAGSKTIVYGPSSDAGRFPNAYTEIENMVTCTKVLALTALGICRKAGSQQHNFTSRRKIRI